MKHYSELEIWLYNGILGIVIGIILIYIVKKIAEY
jgi:hypothetical protein